MATVLYPEALRIGLVLLAAALAGLAFAWRRQGLSLRRLAALLGLRAALLLGLLVFVCRPVWIGERGDGAVPRIAVLIDRSESMSLVEQGESRYARAGRFARDVLLPAVERRGWREDLYEFDEAAKPVRVSEIAAGRPAGRLTDLGRAVEQALAASETPPFAVVALTDGVSNAHARDRSALASLLASHGVFVGVAVGENRDLATLTLERLSGPTRAAPGEAYTLSVRIRAVSSGEVPAFDLLLFRDGQLVDQKRVASRSGSHSWTESFERLEEAEGTHLCTARIVPGDAGGPVVLRGEANTSVRVAREDELRLLFVQGALTWDFKFIHLALADDPVLKLTGVSRTSERSVFRQGVESRDELAGGLPDDPAKLAPFRVVVLAGLDPRDLSTRQQETLARWVSELGGAVLLLGGPSTFTPDWRGSRLEEMLPVLFEDERGVVGLDAPFGLELTEDGLRDAVFRVSDTTAVASVWNSLPAFDSYGRVAEAKPGATVWAVHQRDVSAHGRRILMATQRYGAGITAVVALENFWRWRLDRDAEPEQFDRFWRQLFRYLAQVGRQDINVFFPDQDLEPGGEVRAVIERRGGDVGAGSVRHHVSVEGPGGKTVAEHKVDLAHGDSATVRFDARDEGLYQVRVEWPGAPLPVAEPVEIRRASRELERTARDLETLEQWATMSGGLATTVEDIGEVDRLLDRVQERAQAMRRKERAPEAAGLGPIPFAALIAAIAAEIALRVRWGLL